MTPAARFFRNLLERLLGKYHEGPEPPVRLAEEARLFAVSFPGASSEEWERFASALAAKAYREAWTRGFEWAERDLDAKPKDDPDVLAEELRHAWTIGGHDARVDEMLALGDPFDPLRGVPEENKAAFLNAMGRRAGFRVVDEDGNEPPE